MWDIGDLKVLLNGHLELFDFLLEHVSFLGVLEGSGSSLDASELFV